MFMRSLLLVWLIGFASACGTSSRTPSGPLEYSVVERNDLSFPGRSRINNRVLLQVDRLPTDDRVRATAEQVWREGNTGHAEFTAFFYLPEMNMHGAAYAVAEYTPAGLKKFQTNDFALYGTRWRSAEAEAAKADSAWTQQKRAPTVQGYQLTLTATKVSPRRLRIRATTDLPDGTMLYVSVDRQYHERNNDETYSGEIFERDVAVQAGHVELEIEVDDSRWYQKRREDERKFAGMGVFGELGRISDEVDVSVLFSPRRTQSQEILRKLGRNGEHVGGAGARRSGDFTVYEAEEKVKVPFRV